MLLILIFTDTVIPVTDLADFRPVAFDSIIVFKSIEIDILLLVAVLFFMVDTILSSFW